MDKLVRVYRERDTKLDRDVAIKVLPSALAQDPQRLARFEREAKVLAPLNHPNIAQIYDVEQGALVKPHMGRGAIGVDALHGADFELRIDRSFFDVQNS